MKLARFTHDGSTRLGVVLGDELADVGTLDPTLPTDVGDLLGTSGVDRAAALVAGAARLELAAVRLEAPIVRPPEFLAVGLNYGSHVADRERPAPMSDHPQIFNKQSTCIAGPHDDIVIPRVAPSRVDYEGELGVVIGRRCRAVPRESAAEVVAGYLVVNDVSVRDWQRASPTITMGKSWDTHGPIGPWLVTSDEVVDPHRLRLQTWVDDELRQDDTTANLINDCWALIAYLSTAFTLLPGMIIATGTPTGTGVSFDPARILQPGQRVKVSIESIGSLDNPVVAQADAE